MLDYLTLIVLILMLLGLSIMGYSISTIYKINKKIRELERKQNESNFKSKQFHKE